MNGRHPLVIAVSVVVLGAIEIAAILKGIDGAYLSIVVGAISGIVGYAVKSARAEKVKEIRK